MTFEEWWEEYHKVSIYGKGYKALAKDAWDAGHEDGYDDGWMAGKRDADEQWMAMD